MPARFVAGSELEEVRLPAINSADGKRAPEMIAEMVPPSVSLVHPRKPGIVIPGRDFVSKLHDGAEATDDVFVAAVETDVHGIPRDVRQVDDAGSRAGHGIGRDVCPYPDLAIAVEMPLQTGSDVA